MDEQEQHEQGELIKLDGSAGLGDNALVTIITKDAVDGEREETFVIPMALLNHPVLDKCMSYKFIMGYKILRQEKPKGEGL